MHLLDARQTRWKVLLFVAFLCASITGCEEWLQEKGPKNKKEQPRTVYALGKLRPKSGVIDILATPGDRVKELADGVEVNDPVPENGILGKLDSYDMGREQLFALVKKKRLAKQKHEQQKRMANAQLANARATEAQALAKQEEVCLQAKKLEVLEVKVQLERDEFHKLEALWKDDAELVTQHQLDKQRNKLNLANKELEIARHSALSAKTAADAALAAAEASVSAALLAHDEASKGFSEQLETQLIEQEIEIAEEALKRSFLLAPGYWPTALEDEISNSIYVATDEDSRQETTGSSDKQVSKPVQFTALKVFSKAGEVVTQTPIMKLADLSEMICVAEVYEADRKELRNNQQVVIRSPAFSGYYLDREESKKLGRKAGGIVGRVTEIGLMIAPAGVPSRNPLAPTDRSVVEVAIEIDSDANQQALEVVKEMLSKDEKEESEDWITDPNEMAARHVGLQVTIEFLKEREQEQTKSDNSENQEESAKSQAAE